MAWTAYTPGTPWSWRTGKSCYQAQSATPAAPSGADDGLDLESVAGFSLWVVADTGTFTSAATVLTAYRYDAAVGVWARSPELDVTLGASAVGASSYSTVFSVASPRGRIAHIWDGTGLAAGGVTVSYTASVLTGERA